MLVTASVVLTFAVVLASSIIEAAPSKSKIVPARDGSDVCPSQCRKKGDVLLCHKTHVIHVQQLQNCVSRSLHLQILDLGSWRPSCHCAQLLLALGVSQSNIFIFIPDSCRLIIKQCGQRAQLRLDPAGSMAGTIVMRNDVPKLRTASRRRLALLWAAVDSLPPGLVQDRYRRVIHQLGRPAAGSKLSKRAVDASQGYFEKVTDRRHGPENEGKWEKLDDSFTVHGVVIHSYSPGAPSTANNKNTLTKQAVNKYGWETSRNTDNDENVKNKNANDKTRKTGGEKDNENADIGVDLDEDNDEISRRKKKTWIDPTLASLGALALAAVLTMITIFCCRISSLTRKEQRRTFREGDMFDQCPAVKDMCRKLCWYCCNLRGGSTVRSAGGYPNPDGPMAYRDPEDVRHSHHLRNSTGPTADSTVSKEDLRSVSYTSSRPSSAAGPHVDRERNNSSPCSARGREPGSRNNSASRRFSRERRSSLSPHGRRRSSPFPSRGRTKNRPSRPTQNATASLVLRFSSSPPRRASLVSTSSGQGSFSSFSNKNSDVTLLYDRNDISFPSVPNLASSGQGASSTTTTEVDTTRPLSSVCSMPEISSLACGRRETNSSASTPSLKMTNERLYTSTFYSNTASLQKTLQPKGSLRGSSRKDDDVTESKKKTCEDDRVSVGRDVKVSSSKYNRKETIRSESIISECMSEHKQAHAYSNTLSSDGRVSSTSSRHLDSLSPAEETCLRGDSSPPSKRRRTSLSPDTEINTGSTLGVIERGTKEQYVTQIEKLGICSRGFLRSSSAPNMTEHFRNVSSAPADTDMLVPFGQPLLTAKNELAASEWPENFTRADRDMFQLTSIKHNITAVNKSIPKLSKGGMCTTTVRERAKLAASPPSSSQQNFSLSMSNAKHVMHRKTSGSKSEELLIVKPVSAPDQYLFPAREDTTELTTSKEQPQIDLSTGETFITPLTVSNYLTSVDSDTRPGGKKSRLPFASPGHIATSPHTSCSQCISLSVSSVRENMVKRNNVSSKSESIVITKAASAKVEVSVLKSDELYTNPVEKDMSGSQVSKACTSQTNLTIGKAFTASVDRNKHKCPRETDASTSVAKKKSRLTKSNEHIEIPKYDKLNPLRRKASRPYRVTESVVSLSKSKSARSGLEYSLSQTAKTVPDTPDKEMFGINISLPQTDRVAANSMTFCRLQTYDSGSSVAGSLPASVSRPKKSASAADHYKSRSALTQEAHNSSETMTSTSFPLCLNALPLTEFLSLDSTSLNMSRTVKSTSRRRNGSLSKRNMICISSVTNDGAKAISGRKTSSHNRHPVRQRTRERRHSSVFGSDNQGSLSSTFVLPSRHDAQNITFSSSSRSQVHFQNTFRKERTETSPIPCRQNISLTSCSEEENEMSTDDKRKLSVYEGTSPAISKSAPAAGKEIFVFGSGVEWTTSISSTQTPSDSLGKTSVSQAPDRSFSTNKEREARSSSSGDSTATESVFRISFKERNIPPSSRVHCASHSTLSSDIEEKIWPASTSEVTDSEASFCTFRNSLIPTSKGRNPSVFIFRSAASNGGKDCTSDFAFDKQETSNVRNLHPFFSGGLIKPVYMGEKQETATAVSGKYCLLSASEVDTSVVCKKESGPQNKKGRIPPSTKCEKNMKTRLCTASTDVHDISSTTESTHPSSSREQINDVSSYIDTRILPIDSSEDNVTVGENADRCSQRSRGRTSQNVQGCQSKQENICTVCHHSPASLSTADAKDATSAASGSCAELFLGDQKPTWTDPPSTIDMSSYTNYCLSSPLFSNSEMSSVIPMNGSDLSAFFRPVVFPLFPTRQIPTVSCGMEFVNSPKKKPQTIADTFGGTAIAPFMTYEPGMIASVLCSLHDPTTENRTGTESPAVRKQNDLPTPGKTQANLSCDQKKCAVFLPARKRGSILHTSSVPGTTESARMTSQHEKMISPMTSKNGIQHYCPHDTRKPTPLASVSFPKAPSKNRGTIPFTAKSFSAENREAESFSRKLPPFSSTTNANRSIPSVTHGANDPLSSSTSTQIHISSTSMACNKVLPQKRLHETVPAIFSKIHDGIDHQELCESTEGELNVLASTENRWNTADFTPRDLGLSSSETHLTINYAPSAFCRPNFSACQRPKNAITVMSDKQENIPLFEKECQISASSGSIQSSLKTDRKTVQSAWFADNANGPVVLEAFFTPIGRTSMSSVSDGQGMSRSSFTTVSSISVLPSPVTIETPKTSMGFSHPFPVKQRENCSSDILGESLPAASRDHGECLSPPKDILRDKFLSPSRELRFPAQIDQEPKAACFRLDETEMTASQNERNQTFDSVSNRQNIFLQTKNHRTADLSDFSKQNIFHSSFKTAFRSPKTAKRKTDDSLLPESGIIPSAFKSSFTPFNTDTNEVKDSAFPESEILHLAFESAFPLSNTDLKKTADSVFYDSKTFSSNEPGFHLPETDKKEVAVYAFSEQNILPYEHAYPSSKTDKDSVYSLPSTFEPAFALSKTEIKESNVSFVGEQYSCQASGYFHSPNEQKLSSPKTEDKRAAISASCEPLSFGIPYIPEKRKQSVIFPPCSPFLNSPCADLRVPKSADIVSFQKASSEAFRIVHEDYSVLSESFSVTARRINVDGEPTDNQKHDALAIYETDITTKSKDNKNDIGIRPVLSTICTRQTTTGHSGHYDKRTSSGDVRDFSSRTCYRSGISTSDPTYSNRSFLHKMAKGERFHSCGGQAFSYAKSQKATKDDLNDQNISLSSECKSENPLITSGGKETSSFVESRKSSNDHASLKTTTEKYENATPVAKIQRTGPVLEKNKTSLSHSGFSRQRKSFLESKDRKVSSTSIRQEATFSSLVCLREDTSYRNPSVSIGKIESICSNSSDKDTQISSEGIPCTSLSSADDLQMKFTEEAAGDSTLITDLQEEPMTENETLPIKENKNAERLTAFSIQLNKYERGDLTQEIQPMAETDFSKDESPKSQLLSGARVRTKSLQGDLNMYFSTDSTKDVAQRFFHELPDHCGKDKELELKSLPQKNAQGSTVEVYKITSRRQELNDFKCTVRPKAPNLEVSSDKPRPLPRRKTGLSIDNRKDCRITLERIQPIPFNPFRNEQSGLRTESRNDTGIETAEDSSSGSTPSLGLSDKSASSSSVPSLPASEGSTLSAMSEKSSLLEVPSFSSSASGSSGKSSTARRSQTSLSLDSSGHFGSLRTAESDARFPSFSCCVPVSLSDTAHRGSGAFVYTEQDPSFDKTDTDDVCSVTGGVHLFSFNAGGCKNGASTVSQDGVVHSQRHNRPPAVKRKYGVIPPSVRKLYFSSSSLPESGKSLGAASYRPLHTAPHGREKNPGSP